MEFWCVGFGERQLIEIQTPFSIRHLAHPISELTVALTKKEEKLKKKEKLLEEYSSSGESQKQEISEIKNLNKRLEQALAKKEKQYTKVQEKLSTFEQIQAQIFSLSKTVQSKDDDEQIKEIQIIHRLFLAIAMYC